jgi:glutamate formiminotransferase
VPIAKTPDEETMLACVVNVSEGRHRSVIDALNAAGGRALLDVHSDPDHHRTVFTMAGPTVEDAVQVLAGTAVDLIDLAAHRGVHPRLGAIDVVPFTPLDDDGSPVFADHDHQPEAEGGPAPTLADAMAARGRFATWAGQTLALPCFLYGPERSLPEVRRRAFAGLDPDTGPTRPHATAGAVAVGARFALLAYNLWLSTTDLDVATSIATAVRRPEVRSLGFATGGATQVSCNLIAPLTVGPAQVYDEVDRLAGAVGTSVSRAELVGLAPAAVVEAAPHRRWRQLDLDPGRTVEARRTASGG